MSEWISVKDKQPEFLVSVLVYMEKIDIIDLGAYMYHDTYSVKSSPDLTKGLVTHWQPLPACQTTKLNHPPL